MEPLAVCAPLPFLRATRDAEVQSYHPRYNPARFGLDLAMLPVVIPSLIA